MSWKKKKEINSHFVRRKNVFDLHGEQQIHLSHHENIRDQWWNWNYNEMHKIQHPIKGYDMKW